jgi:hypothetical protein
MTRADRLAQAEVRAKALLEAKQDILALMAFGDSLTDMQSLLRSKPLMPIVLISIPVQGIVKPSSGKALYKNEVRRYSLWWVVKIQAILRHKSMDPVTRGICASSVLIH